MISQIVISGFRKKAAAMNTQELSFTLKGCKSANITGVSLYAEGVFLNVIEGNEAQTSAIFKAFQKDTRFSEVAIILEKNIDAREFDDYRIGVTGVDVNEKIPQTFHLTPNSCEFFSKKLSSDIAALIAAFAKVNALR